MAEEKQPQPIIIKKIIKKGGHGGHHGGAWKVAYADFVTAMMCLFLLLWLINVDPNTKSVIADYFRQPTQTGPMDGNVFIFGGAKKPADPGKFEGGSSFLQFEKIKLTGQNKEEVLKLIQKDFKKELEVNADKELFDRVKFSLVEDGILMEIKESDEGPLFESGSSVLTRTAIGIIDKLANILKSKVSPLIISGYTDGANYRFMQYDNWNLSSDRAHAVRRRMLYAGLDSKRIARVDGFGDTQLKLPEAPMASVNRRITILLLQSDKLDTLKPKYLNPDDEFEYIQREKITESNIKRSIYEDHESINPEETVSDTDGEQHDTHGETAGSPTAGKLHKQPSLEELRHKKFRDNMRKKYPASASGGSGGHGASGGSSSHGSAGGSSGHGGGGH